MYLTNYKSVALPLPELIGGIQKLGLSLSMPTQGDASPCVGIDRYAVGSRDGTFERAFVSSYRPSIVTFPLSLRVSEILPHFVLQRATFSLPHH